METKVDPETNKQGQNDIRILQESIKGLKQEINQNRKIHQKSLEQVSKNANQAAETSKSMANKILKNNTIFA